MGDILKPVIYIDVLIFFNSIITFLLLAAASRMMKLSPSAGRYLLGSFLGGMTSLMILAPDMGFFLSLVTKLLFSLIIVVAVYNPKSLRAIARETGWFFAVSCLFAGVMLFLSSLPGISIVHYNNGAAYINFSFFSLIASSVLCYALTCLFAKIAKHKGLDGALYSVSVTFAGKTVNGQALLDTGNALADPFTGERVVLANYHFVKSLVPEEVSLWLGGDTEKCEKLRLIPYSAVGAAGLLPCFRADEITIKSGDRSCVLKNAEIAVHSGNIPDLLLPPEALNDFERSQKNERTVKAVSHVVEGHSLKNQTQVRKK